MYLRAQEFARTFLLALLIIVFFSAQAFAMSIWDVDNDENMLEGVFLSCCEDYVRIVTKNGIRTFALASNPFTAMIGSSSGYLLKPAYFPPLIRIELILDRYGKVRAMRNKQEAIVAPYGQKLPVSGHDAILSPDGKNYLLYHFASGLFLHSITDKCTPVFLSESFLGTWNPTGTKIACFYEDKLLIYDILKHSRTLLSLPTVENGLVRIPTGLEWSLDGEKLMYTALEDYPRLGSEVFFVRIIDLAGTTLQTKTVVNLVKVFWQKERIMIVNSADYASDSNRIFLWDTSKEITTEFLPLKKGAYRNTAYNPGTDCLAFTITNGYAEDLYIMDCRQAANARILSLPYPIRNLQWSKKNTLLFSEELNSIIYEISQNDTDDKWALTARATGYLPEHGAAQNFIYFEAEPFEEPQPLFLSQLTE